MLTWPLLSIGLLVASLASFSWAMRKFFFKPSGDNAGMKIIRACSSLSAFLNVVAILATPEVSARQTLMGAALYVSGLVLFYWAIRTHGKRSLSAAFSPDSPNHLVNWGPYRFIRHPFYSSYLMTWMAGFVATGRWWLLLSFAVMVVVYVRAAKMEEDKFASSPLADAYRIYQESTGRFLPRPIAWIKRKEADAPGLA